MICRLRDDDSGAVAVLFAILLVVVIGFAALAVDVGYWYASKRQLQTAADSAALAGCLDLGHKESDSVIEATVDDFAGRNFREPLDGARSTVTETQISENAVKVTLQTDARVFLAQYFLGRGSTVIHAQSVAKLGWLSGGRAPVPWGLSVLKVGELSGTLGGEKVDFDEGSGGYWTGTFSPGRSGPLTIEALNSQGYTDTFSGLVRIGSLPSGKRIVAMDVDKSTLTSGVDSSVFVSVQLASPLGTGPANKYKVEATVDGTKATLTGDATRTQYSGYVNVGTTADPYQTLALSVTVTEDKSTQTVNAGLLLRRANYIIQDVDAHPIAVTSGDAVTVGVKTLDFDYGVQYQMKIEGGAGTTGNYQALAFASLDHRACGYPEFPAPGHSGGSDYRENIVGNPDVVAHIGDYVTTEPGNMVGPTKQGINERLAGVTLKTLEQWEAAGRPETKQLCMVPIVERIEDQNGRAELRIVSFAEFFLESKLLGNDAVIGRFIEWADPGWFVVDDPPGGLAVMAVHLTTDNLDY